ncbi:MAG: hypothetical protein U0575_03725 [Phycisphaerales bacterium]
MPLPLASAAQRTTFESWLLEITAIPTAAGREDRVIEWILAWAKKRKARIAVVADAVGNLLLHQGPVTRKVGRTPTHRPLIVTAHLDHPAFVVREVVDARTIELEFRGGVHDPYFVGAALNVVDRADRSRRAVIQSMDAAARPYKRVRARVAGGTRGLDVGDIARWAASDAAYRERRRPRRGGRHLRTHACDDLAAVAAALAAFELVAGKPGFEHVGVLFTVAEEVGFVGAIATARAGGVPKDARLLCLENSRSFGDSPIGAGAILRVGDRLSVFSPELTNRLGQLYLEHQKRTPSFRFQRKLMPGGACEATAFSAYGYESTCLCLPLGNYHNMTDIDGVLAGKRPAKVGPEFVSVDDFHGLVEMLVVAAAQLDSSEFPPLRDRMEAIFAENRHVLGPSA